MDKRSLLILSAIAVSLNGCGDASLSGEPGSSTPRKAQLDKLEESLQQGHTQDIASKGFHHLSFDDSQCQSQNDSSSGSIPIPGGDDIANYPIPLGIPISPELENQQACTPDVQRTSVQVDNGLLKESFSKFDPLTKAWVERQETAKTNYQLSEAGTWVSVSENNVSITFNEDGTASIQNGLKQQELLLQTADLSGKALNLMYSENDSVADNTNDKSSEEASLESRINVAGATSVFPQGALAIRKSFKQLNTSYEISSLSCPKNSAETFNDNCNIIRKPDGSAATSINADMFFSVESTPASSQHSLQLGSLKIQLQLTHEQTSDFTNATSGAVRFSSIDISTQNESIETGQWTKRNLQGIEIYSFELPSSARENGRVKTIFFAEQNGYVRQGVLLSEGDIQIDNDWFINTEALDSLTSLLQSL
jgi:hypothetical protein